MNFISTILLSTFLFFFRLASYWLFSFDSYKILLVFSLVVIRA